MGITLDAIDQVRERTGVSYRRAYDALQAAGGDVVHAIIELESQSGPGMPGWLADRGQSVAKRLGRWVREGNATRLVVRHHDRTLLQVPATVGALGAVLLPTATAIGVLAALASDASISIERH